MGFLRLANALVVFLAALLMLVLGAGEGTPQRPTLLFWLLLLLPLLLLPWLWRTLQPEDAADGPEPSRPAASSEFGTAVSDSRRWPLRAGSDC